MPLIKTSSEIKKITAAGTILKSVLAQVALAAREGVSLLVLNALAERLIREAGATPSFLGYQPYGAARPYPAALCASVNDVIVHGVPTRRRLRAGDILKLDLGVCYAEFHADAAITVAIGTVPEREAEIIRVAREALQLGIRAARPGNTLGDIGHAIGRHITAHGFAVAEGLTGHGIGRELHEEPHVWNEGKPGAGLALQPGMALAIEPMVTMGKGKLRQSDDDAYATEDGSMTAHFEHTVIVTERGARVVT